MNEDLQKVLETLKVNLNSGKTDVQCTLCDLVNSKRGQVDFGTQWKSTVENMMWNVAKIIPADEAFSDCDESGDFNDLMFLINHDGNFSFYVYEKYVSSDKEPSPISKQVANKIINYVAHHLSDIQSMVNTEKDCLKVLAN